MTFDEYQKRALTTAPGHAKKNEVFHLVLGLVSEASEIAAKFQKMVRDNDSDEATIDIKNLQKELGDTLWYIATLADYFDISLDELATSNLAKLADRKKRGVIGGSGDNR